MALTERFFLDADAAKRFAAEVGAPAPEFLPSGQARPDEVIGWRGHYAASKIKQRWRILHRVTVEESQAGTVMLLPDGPERCTTVVERLPATPEGPAPEALAEDVPSAVAEKAEAPPVRDLPAKPVRRAPKHRRKRGRPRKDAPSADEENGGAPDA